MNPFQKKTYLSSMVLISCQRTRPLRVATKATEMPNSLNIACLQKIQKKKSKKSQILVQLQHFLFIYGIRGDDKQPNRSLKCIIYNGTHLNIHFPTLKWLLKIEICINFHPSSKKKILILNAAENKMNQLSRRRISSCRCHNEIISHQFLLYKEIGSV